jgi:hypothetical protein
MRIVRRWNPIFHKYSKRQRPSVHDTYAPCLSIIRNPFINATFPVRFKIICDNGQVIYVDAAPA